MLLGINTNNECGQNIKEVLSNIKSAGFESVMVAFKVGKAEETLKEALSLGLKVPYVHLTNSNNLWTEGEMNKELMESLKEQIKICSKYKVPIAVLHATTGTANELALPPNLHGLKCVLEIVKFAKENKVKIAIENLDKPNFKHFSYVMDNIDNSNLGFCYDIGHHQLYLPNVDLLKKYGDRLVALHLHDNLMDWHYGYDWTRDLHMLPFDGKIDYKKVLKKIANTTYNNVVMLEVHKEACAEPKKYQNTSNKDFLVEAKKRAEMIDSIIENYRK